MTVTEGKENLLEILFIYAIQSFHYWLHFAINHTIENTYFINALMCAQMTGQMI